MHGERIGFYSNLNLFFAKNAILSGFMQARFTFLQV
jgi:hypothetical protein